MYYIAILSFTNTLVKYWVISFQAKLKHSFQITKAKKLYTCKD